MNENEKKLILLLMNVGLDLSWPYVRSNSALDENDVTIKELSDVSGIHYDEIENMIKVLPRWSFNVSPNVKALAFYLGCHADETISYLVKKFKNKQSFNKHELNNLVEIVCKDKDLSYSSDLTERVANILNEYSQGKVLRGKSYSKIFGSAVLLARKQIGGHEISRYPTQEFKSMLADIDGVPQPSKRVELYIQTLLNKIPVPKKEIEGVIKSCIDDYNAAIQKDRRITGKDPAIIAGALLKRELVKRNYFWRNVRKVPSEYTDKEIANALKRSEISVRNLKNYIIKLLD